MSLYAPTLFPDVQREPSDVRTTGVLPSQRLEDLISAGHIRARVPISPDQIQPSSLDLRLGPTAYEVDASFLPVSDTVEMMLKHLQRRVIDLSSPALLERGKVYVVPLLEELSLPAGHRGTANPKSSTGRIDVFTRLLTDYGEKFHQFEVVREGYTGRLYAEVAPVTFPIIVREGSRLNQLRIRIGNPRRPGYRVGLYGLNDLEPLVFSQDNTPEEPLIQEGLWLRVDLEGIEETDVVGYRAKKGGPPIDLERVNHHDPSEYWEPLRRNASRAITLHPNDFYILTSKNKVSVPPTMAAEMFAFDPLIGELRVHYAGFFDPGFGWDPEKPEGNHAVLEVRSYMVPSLLEDGQVVARLDFEPLLARPSKIYGQGIGSSYQSQKLALSKHFKSHY